MLMGNSVYLRAVERADLETLRMWRNDPAFKRNFREYREISTDMQENWFAHVVNNDDKTIMFSICQRETGDLLGCCGLCYINWIQRNADLSLYVGYNSVYIDDCGYAKEACRLLFDYAFLELGLHKLWTELYEYDTKKIEFYIKEFGFKKDGFLRDNHFMDGRWYGSWILSLIEGQ